MPRLQPRLQPRLTSTTLAIMSFPNLSSLSLHDLSKLGDDTGPKMGKEKNPAGKPPYAVIVIKELDTDDSEDVDIRTYPNVGGSGGPSNATEAERAWLRKTYGNDWSNVPEKNKTNLKNQARRALSFKFAPIIKAAQEETRVNVTNKFKLENYADDGVTPKLDWKTEVLPRLNKKHPPDWRKDSDGNWLSENEKNDRSNKAKEELRIEKKPQLKEKLAQLVKQKEEEMLNFKIEDLNYPDEKLKRKGRALCRHWFNRKGKDGKMRNWALDVDYYKSKPIIDQRLKWAKEEVQKPSYNPDNPPRPPKELYLPLDVYPEDESFLPDEVPNISNEGGEWLWNYMRQLEAMNIEETQDFSAYVSDVGQPAQYWNSDFRAAQRKRLNDSYTDFIESVNEMSNIPYAKDVAISYTSSSTPFNKYMLWPSSKVGGDPSKIPTQGEGKGGVGGAYSVTQIGPPDKLHRLYKLINRCPRLDEDAVFLRSVNKLEDLPHNIGKETPVNPEIGKGYLNVTFMSTSSADPSDYLSGALGTFYNKKSSCCMYALTVPKGSPVLPLVVGGNNMSTFSSEQEVVLPPGLVLVYQGERELLVGTQNATIHFYKTMLPLKVGTKA